MSYEAVVVGAGGISRAWFPPLLAEEVQLPYVVDLDVEAARNRIEQYELPSEATDDLSAALAKARPDFVVDLTTPEAHAKVTRTALEAGCHVIGEKPMAASMDEARQMVKAAEDAGKCYMVSQSRRWNPSHEAVRQALVSGAIGAVTTINCDFYVGAHFGGFRAEMDSPLVLDMAIHHFDLARFFTARDPLAVYAHEFNPRGSWYAGDVAGSAIFEMTGESVFTYRGSWCSEGFTTSWNGNWRIIGEKGTLLYEQDEHPRMEVAGEGEGLVKPGAPVDVPAVEMDKKGMHGALAEMLHFLDTGELPQTECHDNVKSLSMVFGAMESSRAKHRLELQPE